MTESLSDFKVIDRKSFIEFIKLLREDLVEHPSTWENDNLHSFLNAVAAYTKDIQGYYDNKGERRNAEEASWQLMADILKGATVYE